MATTSLSHRGALRGVLPSRIQTTVSRVQTMGLTNIYGYELWNEPQGTYSASNPVPSFNDFWMQTFAEIRMRDPNAKIIGPSIAAYDGAFISTPAPPLRAFFWAGSTTARSRSS